MADDTKVTARQVAEQLAASGHAEQAAHLHTALNHAGNDMLGALRAACQTILTAIEAVDPTSATMVEDLRLAVDARLRRSADQAGG